MPFILVFAESGALYTINVLASLVMHVRGSLGQLIAIDMQPSLVVSHNPRYKRSSPMDCLLILRAGNNLLPNHSPNQVQG